MTTLSTNAWLSSPRHMLKLRIDFKKNYYNIWSLFYLASIALSANDQRACAGKLMDILDVDRGMQSEPDEVLTTLHTLDLVNFLPNESAFSCPVW